MELFLNIFYKRSQCYKLQKYVNVIFRLCWGGRYGTTFEFSRKQEDNFSHFWKIELKDFPCINRYSLFYRKRDTEKS